MFANRHAVLVVLLAGAGLPAHPGRAAALTNAAALRALSHEQAGRAEAVTLCGVVTFAERGAGSLYLQDESGGIAVKADAVRALASMPRTGDRVRISGVAATGPFSPVIDGGPDGIRIEALGTGALPRPVPLTSVDLEGGTFDGQRVAVEAVIRNMKQDGNNLRIEMGTRVGRLTVIVPGTDTTAAAGLLHARVRATGVLRSIANSRRQWVGNMMLVPALSDIAVLTPPPADLFALPVRRVDELSRAATPGADVEPVVLRGTVTFHHPGYRFFLRGEGGTIEVQTMLGWTGVLAPGDLVEVAGYPILLRKRVLLHDGIPRVREHGPAPAPVPVTVAQALGEDINGELVRIEGTLVQITRRAGQPVLFIESGPQIVEALYPQGGPSAAEERFMASLPVGALVRVTGISDVQGSMQLDGSVLATHFGLLIRDPGDIAILRPPPFWTTARLLAAVGVLAAVGALFATWSVMLRRRVSQQTEIIRDNVRREAVWEERSRIAQDIHDDVGAALTQISLLGEIGRRAGASPETMSGQLGKVVAKSRDAVRALDEIVWTVNPVNDSLERAASYFCQTAQDLLHETSIRCRLFVADDLPARSLGAKVRHNLFLAIKEALHNVVKHSGAGELRFHLSHRGGRLIVRIEDDGRGFDPDAVDRTRNGLTNMARRMADVGGSANVTATPGRGTTVEFSVAV